MRKEGNVRTYNSKVRELNLNVRSPGQETPINLSGFRALSSKLQAQCSDFRAQNSKLRAPKPESPEKMLGIPSEKLEPPCKKPGISSKKLEPSSKNTRDFEKLARNPEFRTQSLKLGVRKSELLHGNAARLARTPRFEARTPAFKP